MPSCPVCRTRYPEGARHCPQHGDALLDDAAFTNVDRELSPGDVVGEYVIEAKIGQGGFGAVYSAVHPIIGKRAALKTLHRQHSTNPPIVARFIAEAKAVNQIRHRNIIDIFSFGNLPDGRHYFLMELLEGRTLEDYFRSKGTLTLEEALPILRGVARALDAAHAKGIAHRDLKPENIFLVADEGGGYTPKLLDFGVAKLSAAEEGGFKTRTGVPIGTPYYMSPEQARGLNVDYRTDIYALGVLCHQILTGVVPFDGASVMDVLMAHTIKVPPSMSTVSPKVPVALDEAVLHMLAKDPTSRPSSVGAAMDELEAAGRRASSPAPAFPSYKPGTPSDFEHPDRPPPLAHAQTNDPSFGHTQESPVPPSRAKRTLALAGSVLAVVLVGVWFGLAPNRRALPIAVGVASTLTPVTSAAPGGSSSPVSAIPGMSGDASVAPPSPPGSVAVMVISTPPTATISLGASTLGRAPFPFVLPAGSSQATLTLSYPGYKSANVDITPSTGGTVRVTLQKSRVPVAAPISSDLSPF